MKSKSEEYKKELAEVFHKIGRDRMLTYEFLKDIFTPREFDNISVRWQIVKRLAKGEHQQAIAEDLHLGVATITRGTREMRDKDGGFRKTLRFLHLE